MNTSQHSKNNESPSAADTNRRHMIAETAYFIAQRRGFAGHNEQTLADWFQAEQIVDDTNRKVP